MGTTSRAFDNTRKIGITGSGHTSRLSLASMLTAMFSGNGSIFGGLTRGAGMKRATFTTPTHSPHLCGRRTEEERQQRKSRRQKRTALKQKRGYA